MRIPDPTWKKVIVESSDAQARQRLHELVAKGEGAITAELPIIDGFVAAVAPDTLTSLKVEAAMDGDSVTITPDRTFTLADPDPAPSDTGERGGPARPGGWALNVATETLDLPKVWSQGYRGKGIGIAIIDTGIARHPDLADRIVAFKDVVDGQNDPYDDRGHGTHVAGIVAGSGQASDGKYQGAAPEASLIGIKVMNREGKGDLSGILEGLQWAVDHRQDYNIRVINMSLGARPEVPVAKDPLVKACHSATDQGILVVAAAGNKGPYPQTIDTPAISARVLAVGATMDYRTPDMGDDKVAWYSGTGPTRFDNLTKPDVLAPGTNIMACDTEGSYKEDTGTSMASPLVAGVAALMFQARPEMTPGQMKDVLRNTAQKIRRYDENVQGKGVVRPLASLDHLLRGERAEGVQPVEANLPSSCAASSQPSS